MSRWVDKLDEYANPDDRVDPMILHAAKCADCEDKSTLIRVGCEEGDKIADEVEDARRVE